MAGNLILVSGGTGYVGGLLTPRLLERGYRVRLLVREPARLDGRSWRPQVEVVEGDLLSPARLQQAMQGVSAAFYLVHNMASGRNYTEKEIDAARNFAAAAMAASLKQVIYLGGLADPAEDIGRHLRSRIQTGELLRQGTVPVTEFRASLIIGAGSISFEMIRYLTEQFPLLVGPGWMRNCTQPIAIQNVLDYLLSALEDPVTFGEIYEIGGAQALSYAETLRIYAEQRGLKRRLVALPLPVKGMAAVAGILTPVSARIAGPLLGGMRSDSVVCTDAARRDFPDILPMSYAESVAQALKQLCPESLDIPMENGAASFRIVQAGFFVEGRQVRLDVPPGAVYRVLTGLGGRHGWLALNGLWKLRGWIDRLVGGPGLRGRRSADELVEGDPLDYYRVETLERDHLVRLRAELKAPGQGWMEWRLRPAQGKAVYLTQIAYFAPKGVSGFLYWYLLLPVHRLAFAALVKAIARRADADQRS
jgi:uncharacterized protein YbjT (DUF2867 family)